jgi:hypothetical protein
LSDIVGEEKGDKSRVPNKITLYERAFRL